MNYQQYHVRVSILMACVSDFLDCILQHDYLRLNLLDLALSDLHSTFRFEALVPEDVEGLGHQHLFDGRVARRYIIASELSFN